MLNAHRRERIQDRVDDGTRRPTVPPSPAPLTPSGFVGLGTSRLVTDMRRCGRRRDNDPEQPELVVWSATRRWWGPGEGREAAAGAAEAPARDPMKLVVESSTPGVINLSSGNR